jgi:hypothetical protein
MSIKVGDRVVWREGKSKPGRKGLPMGIANCHVLEIGETADGTPAARISLPMRLPDWPDATNVLLADLELSDDGNGHR